VVVRAWGAEGRPVPPPAPEAKFVLLADERRSIDITLPGAEDGRR
jgi:hypothetical protein